MDLTEGTLEEKNWMSTLEWVIWWILFIYGVSYGIFLGVTS